MADNAQIKNIIEAALLAAGKPLDLDHLRALFEEDQQPEKKQLRELLTELAADYEGRGIEIVEVASGWRIQVRADYSRWVSRLWEEKPSRYSRALMETLALIAYRQPITRGEIEEIRGVSVSSNITKTLLEREWIRVVGQRDVPGKPSLYGTTRTFLDYFNLKGLDDLPTLAEIRDLDEINRALDLDDPDRQPEAANQADDGARPADEGAAGASNVVALAGPEDEEEDPPSEQATAETVDGESGFDDVLPEFESDWDELDSSDADSVAVGEHDSTWADELASELEDELLKSELRSERNDPTDPGHDPDKES